MTESDSTNAPEPGVEAGSAATAAMDARYGRTRSRGVDRKIVFSTIGVVIAGVIIWALFGGWGGGATTIEHQSIGFEIAENEITLKYQVSAPPNSRVACALEATSQSFATVGWKVIEFEPSAERTREFSETIRTIREPNSAFVSYCWALESAD